MIVVVGVQESFEWVDFRELTDEEIKPHSLHPLPLPKPAPLLAQSLPLAVAPVVVPQVPGTTPAQVSAVRLLCRHACSVSLVDRHYTIGTTLSREWGS